MPQNRLILPGLLALLVLLWTGWQIYAGWGLVTLDLRDAPLSKALAAISRQGGIEIASNVDPTIPVTIKVKRVPPVEALDIVAVRAEATWRLTYLGAPEQAAINTALADFRAGGEAPGWTSYGAGGFNLVAPQSGAALDLRRVTWTPSEPGGLPALLEEAAQKTGVLLAAPAEWNPSVSAPSAGPIATTAPRLFRDAGGVSREVFLLRARPSRGDDDWGGGGRGGSWIGSGSGGGGRGGGWMRALGDGQRTEERVEAQIALLPKNEQEKAREDSRLMRQFWQEVRDLPEDQRRAKAQEFFNRPEVAERMDERRMAREAKMTPQQRVERAKQYFERKQAAKSQQNSNP
ncbi:MAG: hypothetical protein WEC72_02640 [Chthoniobacterales bacterium]